MAHNNKQTLLSDLRIRRFRARKIRKNILRDFTETFDLLCLKGALARWGDRANQMRGQPLCECNHCDICANQRDAWRLHTKGHLPTSRIAQWKKMQPMRYIMHTVQRDSHTLHTGCWSQSSLDTKDLTERSAQGHTPYTEQCLKWTMSTICGRGTPWKCQIAWILLLKGRGGRWKEPRFFFNSLHYAAIESI